VFALIDINLWPIFHFSKWRPSAILDLFSACKDYLLVFVTVQNLVVIGAVISVVCNFNILHVKLENAYSRIKNRGFGGFYPQNEEQYERDSQKAHPWAETRGMTYRSSKSVHVCGLGGSRRI